MSEKLITITLVMLLIPGIASALICNPYLGEVSVKVAGATRTKPQFMESLVRSCLERGGYQTWDSVDPAAMGQCLGNSRLFSKVEVEVAPPQIAVLVAERWTLIAIPNAYASGDKRSFGVFVREANLFGYGKQVGIGGAVSTEGNSFFLMYMDPGVGFTDYTCKVFAFRSAAEREAYAGSTMIDSYDRIEESFALSPGYRISPDLNVSLSLQYADKRYSQVELYAIPADYRAWSVGASLAYSNSDYKLFYNDGLSVHLDWFEQLHRSDEAARLSAVTAKVEWDLAVFANQALQLGLRAASQSAASHGDVAIYGLGRGYRGIQPGGLWTNRIVAVSADYQMPLAKWRHGTVTGAPFVDYGIYKAFFAENRSNYLAYGVGGYYFMNFINLPGLGLTVGVNEKFLGPFVSLQFGMGF